MPVGSAEEGTAFPCVPVAAGGGIQSLRTPRDAQPFSRDGYSHSCHRLSLCYNQQLVVRNKAKGKLILLGHSWD